MTIVYIVNVQVLVTLVFDIPFHVTNQLITNIRLYWCIVYTQIYTTEIFLISDRVYNQITTEIYLISDGVDNQITTAISLISDRIDNQITTEIRVISVTVVYQIMTEILLISVNN